MNPIGIGLRGPHYENVVAEPHPVGWYEVHSENFFGLGGTAHKYLSKVRNDYPVSMHGVGLSLGSADPLCETHLAKLSTLIDRYQPMLVSEHLSWSSINGIYLHDLLPLPMNREVADHLVSRIDQVQEALKRQILIENASTYLEFSNSQMSEWDFICNIAERSGCGVLLDVNNVYVNSRIHGFDAIEFMTGIPAPMVQEIHLAGHTVNTLEDGEILIDTHDQRVCEDVWDLYRVAAQLFPDTPTLIEWDKDLPEFEVLLAEAAIAKEIQIEAKRDAAA